MASSLNVEFHAVSMYSRGILRPQFAHILKVKEGLCSDNHYA